MSMIARRRIASATGPSARKPSPSGPRCAMLSDIRRHRSTSGAAPSRRSTPQIPHITRWARSTGRAGGRTPRARARSGPRPAAPSAAAAGVQAEGAIGHVLEVVGQLPLPRRDVVLAHLGEAGDAGADREALPHARRPPRQLAVELGAQRARADHRHVAAQNVPELWQLVELRGPQEPPDAGRLLPRRDLQGLAVQAGETFLGPVRRVRNLYIVNVWPARPRRSPRYRTGPPLRARERAAMASVTGAVTASTVPAMATSAARRTTSSRRRSTVEGSRLTAGDGISAPAGASGSGGLTTDIGARAGSAALARMLPPGAARRRARSLDCSHARATAILLSVRR